MTTSLYIIDEYEKVRSALAERLSQSTSLSVLGHGSDCAMVLQEIDSLRPDIILIEVKRRDGMGLELTRQLASLSYAPRLVVLTSYQKTWEEQAAARAGAATYLLKELNSEDLIHKIETLAAA